MELKSLLLGLAFTVGIFTEKSGARLSYLFEKRRGWPHYLAVAALYFLLTVIIVPHFSEIERIYRLSSGKELTSPDGWKFFVILLAASLTDGIIRSYRRPM